MRSGNGRHRRPRQAPAIFVTAGVTGAGIALPLFAASGAHAADTATWDRVAQCASGGVWSAVGSSHYGGLGLTQDLWEEYGGTAYASSPDLASRAQQIAVAETILDARGPGVWSHCAAEAGLKKDGRAPGVDPGSASPSRPAPSGTSDSSGKSGKSGKSETSGSTGSSDTAGSSGSAGSPGSSGGSAGGSSHGPSSGTSDTSPSSSSSAPGAPDSAGPSDAPKAPKPTGSAKPGGPSHSTGPSGGGGAEEAGAPSSGTTGTGKHRGGTGDAGAELGTGVAGEVDDGGRSAGRHASRGGDAHRAAPVAGDYTVRPGDSLSAIAEHQELPGGWPALYDRNEHVIGADADLIQPGQHLDLGHGAGS
ncbi:LysM peptidoglycan-binding domain-containing protein [Streptomyces sp. SID7805]|nr:transglycosylase family protein [Streptomyces sp. SID7805]MYU54617.1 LysM peptidoglycan-binding domain-containing protein [Streptomyces sp. SID7805]